MEYTLKLDEETGDLLFDEEGMLVTVEGDGVTAQNVRLTLDAWRGEFLLDETHGADYDRVFLDENSGSDREEIAREVIREAVFQEKSVILLRNVEASVADGRRLVGSFRGELANGESITMEVTKDG